MKIAYCYLCHANHRAGSRIARLHREQMGEWKQGRARKTGSSAYCGRKK